jgi:hypothetical protein
MPAGFHLVRELFHVMRQSLLFIAHKSSFMARAMRFVTGKSSLRADPVRFVAHKPSFMARSVRFVTGKSSSERDWTPCRRVPAPERFRSVSRLAQRSCQTAGAALPGLVKFVSFPACHAVVAQLPDEGG